jgi:hypothetical protein
LDRGYLFHIEVLSKDIKIRILGLPTIGGSKKILAKTSGLREVLLTSRLERNLAGSSWKKNLGVAESNGAEF